MKIYLPLLPQVSILCREALAKAADESSKQRVALFIDNMKVFHHHLVRAGYPLPDHNLVFALSGDEFAGFLASPETPGSPPARYFMRKAEPLPPFKE